MDVGGQKSQETMPTRATKQIHTIRMYKHINNAARSKDSTIGSAIAHTAKGVCLTGIVSLHG